MRLQLWSEFVLVIGHPHFLRLSRSSVLRPISPRDLRSAAYSFAVFCISSDCYGNLSISSFSLRAIKSPITKEIWEMECLHPQDNNHLTQLESNCIEHDFLGLLQRGKKCLTYGNVLCYGRKISNKLLRCLWANQNKEVSRSQNIPLAIRWLCFSSQRIVSKWFCQWKKTVF